MIHHGDLFDVLPTLAAESVDACVTDPPYELGFMAKAWDGRGVAFNVDAWRAVYRVLKPGAYLVAFGGTRTSHRMVCAIEDAGFQVRDSLVWMYGQGFPKSHNLGSGKGTALKPAHEPIALAWKPFKGSISACHAQHGTAALNIDACRVPVDRADPNRRDEPSRASKNGIFGVTGHKGTLQQARWPANVVIDEEAAAAIDEQTGDIQGAASNGKLAGTGYAGNFGASRFYYVAKPSREERDMGCYDLQARSGGEATDRKDGSAGLNNPRAGAGRTGGARNFHPTVKPVELMRWLVKLVTPIGGTVLDPFLGSGTTGMACVYERREFIGIEREAEYIAIAERRIASVAPLFTETA